VASGPATARSSRARARAARHGACVRGLAQPSVRLCTDDINLTMTVLKLMECSARHSASGGEGIPRRRRRALPLTSGFVHRQHVRGAPCDQGPPAGRARTCSGAHRSDRDLLRDTACSHHKSSDG
jgi:hypothetical protein